MNINKTEFYKIYSNCKRGMLELDIILLNFIELQYSKLDKNSIILLNKLLNESDQDLYYWLVKGENGYNQELNDIIYSIRKTIKTTKFI